MHATVITHVYNEQFLIPYWLRHHREMFDHGIILDYASTDLTVEICHELVPHWEVKQSRNPDFNAVACDAEVIDVENTIAEWKIALTASEFLCTPDLSNLLDSIDNGAKIRPVAMVDMHERAVISTDVPLVQQCHTGFFGGYMQPYKSRLLHRHTNGAYTIGRHDTTHRDIATFPDGALIAWFGYAPWTPELRQRKLQIQNRIPDADRQKGYGVQHMIDETQLYASWQDMVRQSEDLRQYPEFVSAVGL